VSAREIDDAAAAWVARSDAGSLSEQDRVALEAWLALDPRHAGAYARARAVFAWSGRTGASPIQQRPAPDAQHESRPKQHLRPHRRWPGAAVAALVLLATAIGSFAYLRLLPQDRFVTAQGEVRRLSLDDGSTLTLNTASRVHVYWSDAERRVRLLEGEALFDVASDPKRPFIVESAATAVRAVGTSFTVRRFEADRIEIVVREGVVAVDSLDLPGLPSVKLVANTRALDQPGLAPRVEPFDQDQLTKHLSWRDGMIAFDGDTLAEAAREFARYSATPLRVDDAEVAQLRVVGLFASNDPAGFARAAALSLGLETEIDEDGIRLRAPRNSR
jgi:transmembrane sensor